MYCMVNIFNIYYKFILHSEWLKLSKLKMINLVILNILYIKNT